MAQVWGIGKQNGRSQKKNDSAPARAPLSQTLGRTRYIVLLAVIAVMLVAITLFLLGAIQAVLGVWSAWRDGFNSGFATTPENSTKLTVQFLELVSLMLKAVVFYIIGVGLYSLFIAPLNVTVALGVETLSDLESKVVSVVIVIMGITFLEHFIAWEEPLQTLQFGGAFALVVGSLVLFQLYSHQTKEDQKEHNPDEQKRAQQALVQDGDEEHTITTAELQGTASNDGR